MRPAPSSIWPSWKWIVSRNGDVRLSPHHTTSIWFRIAFFLSNILFFVFVFESESSSDPIKKHICGKLCFIWNTNTIFIVFYVLRCSATTNPALHIRWWSLEYGRHGCRPVHGLERWSANQNKLVFKWQTDNGHWKRHTRDNDDDTHKSINHWIGNSLSSRHLSMSGWK